MIAATERGVVLGVPYVDNDRSASRYATKVRDDFVQLLADLRSGTFGADELWLWESSRGSRKVSEWVELLELCESRTVKIFVFTHSRTYDPANGRDRRSLLEDAVDSEYESSKTPARAKRSAASLASAGKPSGITPYGYRRRYDERTRKMVAQDIHEPEATVIRELFTRIESGHTLYAIAQDLEKRGVRNDSGRPFSPQHLRSMARKAAYGGLRSHDDGTTVTLSPGTWEPIVKPVLWRAVQKILDDPIRNTTRPGRAKYLVSGLAVCDVCDGPLYVRGAARGRPTAFQCRTGHVLVHLDELETLAEKVILAYLSRPDVFEALAATDVESPELGQVREQLSAARTELDDTYRLVGAPDGITARALAAIEPRLLAGIAGLEAREADLSAPPALRGLITPGASVARQWKAMAVPARRQVARILLTPGMLGQLRVRRHPPRRGVHVAAHERVEWRTL